jgi:hypothetical protein
LPTCNVSGPAAVKPGNTTFDQHGYGQATAWPGAELRVSCLGVTVICHTPDLKQFWNLDRIKHWCRDHCCNTLGATIAETILFPEMSLPLRAGSIFVFWAVDQVVSAGSDAEIRIAVIPDGQVAGWKVALRFSYR